MIELDRDREKCQDGSDPDRGLAGRLPLRERRRRERRARIVRAAAELFAERGFEATTGREIARRAGIGTGTLFGHVRDKGELLLLVYGNEVERRLAAAPRRAGLREPVSAAVVRVLRPFVDLFARDEALAARFLRELSFRPEAEAARAAGLHRALAARIEALLEDALARGELRADLDCARAARAVLAQFVFWTQAWLGLRACPREAVLPELRAALALLVRGLGSPAAAAGR